MSESSWYYAVDDKQHGPVTTSQLKELIASNTIQPNCLVFRKGLKDWTPANKIPALAVSTVAPPPSPEPVPNLEPGPAPAVVTPGPRRTRDASGLDDLPQLSRKLARFGGYPLLIVGITMVVFAKGCDSIGARGVASIQARQQLEVAQFNDRYEDQELELRKELDSLSAGDARQEIRDRISDLAKKKSEERTELEEGRWRRLKKKVRDAQHKNQMAAYWREIIFVLGALMLTLGLMGVGFTGEGADRWICLIMLAIITFSIFVVGSPWLTSIANSFQ